MIHNRCSIRTISWYPILLLLGVIFHSSAPGLCAADSDETRRLEKLENAVSVLQQENNEMKQENKALKRQIGELQQPVSPRSSAVAASTPEQHPSGATNAVVTSDSKEMTPDLTNNELVTSPKGKSPLALQIGDTTFSLLGFMDFMSITRGTLNGGDTGTSFATFPYSNTANGQLSETRFSAKNSRLGLRIDSDLGDTKILGYVETDFLGNAPANLNVASNSDTLRMRVYFLDARRGPWEILAGQDWSMLTPSRKGISALPNDIFFTQNVDTNYQLGLVWERTPQIRLLYHASNEWTFGLSAENPDQYVGPAVTLPSNFAASQVDNGSNGTATPNLIPDLIGKVAYDTKFATVPFHADLAGLYRDFKINTFLPATGTNTDAQASGYAASFNMNVGILPHLQLIENAYIGNGAGREISTGVAPDFIVTAPDGSGVNHIQTVRSYAGILGFEWDISPNTKLYGYYGQTHIDREFSRMPNGSFVGYGFPGSSNTNNKLIQEYTLGVTQLLWKSERYGDLKLLLQYSYLERDPWSVAAGAPSSAHMHMGYFDVRYDLP
jgi:hypothetical protein